MSKPTVLIVDDCPIFVEYQTTVLEEVGFNILATTDSSEVGWLIRKHHPDLLILDKMMPIDGLTIAEQVREEFNYLPVLILTATTYESDKKKALALGCIDYIRKDMDSKQFIDYIRKFCLVGTINRTMTHLSEKFDKSLDKLEQDLVQRHGRR